MKTFFKTLYISMVQMLATFLMKRTNTVLRYLIVLKGKNPDYLPPPPAPPLDPITKRAPRVIVPMSSYNYYVNSPERHPVLASRKQFEENQAAFLTSMKAPLAPTIEPELEVVDTSTPVSPEDIIEVSGQAIDTLKEAVVKLEQELGLQKLEEEAK